MSVPLLLAAAGAWLYSAAGLAAQNAPLRFAIDAEHSVVGFEVPIAGGVTEVRGLFPDFDGEILYDTAAGGIGVVRVRIRATSVDTGNERRDRHLRSGDFFDVERYPLIDFSGRAVGGAGAGARDGVLEGDLHLLGRTHRLRIPFRRTHEPPVLDVLGTSTVGFEARLPVDRNELGLSANARWNQPVAAVGGALMADTVTLVLRVVAEAETPVRLRYLGTSGWRVVTPGHVLLFDWVEGDAGLDEPTLRDRGLITFVSHGHADHASDSLIARAAEVPDARVVLGWDGPNVPGRVVMGPRETARVGDAAVTTIASTDAGVGFLVEVDGVRIFHAGDHAEWSERSTEAYRAELSWLAERSEADIALLPVATGVRCQTSESLLKGAVHALRALRPLIAAPMHVRCLDRYDIYEMFRARAAREAPAVRILVPTAPGDSWEVGGERPGGSEGGGP